MTAEDIACLHVNTLCMVQRCIKRIVESCAGLRHSAALANAREVGVEQVILPVDLVQCEGVALPLSGRNSLPQRSQVVGTEHALVVGVRMVDFRQVLRKFQRPRQPVLHRDGHCQA